MTSERNPGRTVPFFQNPWLPHPRIDIGDLESRIENTLEAYYGQPGLWSVRVFETNGYRLQVQVRIFDVGFEVTFDERSLRGRTSMDQYTYITSDISRHASTMIDNLNCPAPVGCDPSRKLRMYAQYRGYAYNNAPQPQVRVVPFPQDANNQLLVAKLLELYLEEQVVIDCHEIRIGTGIGEMIFTSPVALRAYLEDVARRRQPALPVPQVTTSHVRRVEL